MTRFGLWYTIGGNPLFPHVIDSARDVSQIYAKSEGAGVGHLGGGLYWG